MIWANNRTRLPHGDRRASFGQIRLREDFDVQTTDANLNLGRSDFLIAKSHVKLNA